MDRVELEHLRSIVTELRRDQKVVESLKSDKDLLKGQLARASDTNRSLEAVRVELEKIREEQGSQLAIVREQHASELATFREQHAIELAKVKQEQAGYIAQLESTRTQEKAHSEQLVKEIEALTGESAGQLEEKS